MFSIGDEIIYGSMGVCSIMDIGLPDISGATRTCYILKPHYVANSKVYAPIENNPVIMRHLLSTAEVQSLIDSMPEIKAFPEDKEKQALYETYRAAIKSADSFMLAKLLKTLREKKAKVLEQKKVVSSVEKEMHDTAEKMLHGEIATALSIPLENVENYIVTRIGTPAEAV